MTIHFTEYDSSDYTSEDWMNVMYRCDGAFSGVLWQFLIYLTFLSRFDNHRWQKITWLVTIAIKHRARTGLFSISWRICVSNTLVWTCDHLGTIFDGICSHCRARKYEIIRRSCESLCNCSLERADSFDSNLGPWLFESAKSWYSLASFI